MNKYLPFSATLFSYQEKTPQILPSKKRITFLLIFSVLLFLGTTTFAKIPGKTLSLTRNNLAEENLKVAFIGSSTALGKGASTPSKAFVNLVQSYYLATYPNYESVNLAASGYDTYRLLPTGSPTVPNRLAPDINRNITAALATNPSIIVCNIPSNDVALNHTNEEYINNLKTIREAANTAGVPIFFTTTQPRNFTDLLLRQQLQEQAGLIRAEFSPWVIDIYDELADGSSLNIKAVYNSGDGIHLNDAGHAYLAATVEKALDKYLLDLEYKNNVNPTVNAGTDQTITLPLNYVTLTSTASDNGSITNYNWEQVTGPAAILNGTDTHQCMANDLVEGTYLFRLTVTDNLGATAFDEITVIVNAAPPVVKVISFTLINANTEQPIRDLVSGEVLDLATLPTQNLNIRVNTNPNLVGSVIMSLTGKQTQNITETDAPYALFADFNGNYNAWAPATGSYILEATPYSLANGSGTAGIPLSINFSVINTTKYNLTLTTTGSGTVTQSPSQTSYTIGSSVKLTASPAMGYKFSGWSGAATGTTNPLTLTMTSNKSITANFVLIRQQVVSFTLINANTEQPIRNLVPNEKLNLATLPTKNLNIRVNTNPAKVGSVKVTLSLNGKLIRSMTETAAPYSLFGDNLGNYSAWTPAVGTYILKATPYTLAGGTGTAGIALSISFSVVNRITTSSRMAEVKEENETTSTSNLLIAYPSPTLNGKLQIEIGSKFEGKITYTLLSATGERLAVSDLSLTKPTSLLSFDFSRQMRSIGLYYLHLQGPNWNKVVKIMRQ